ncbi:hypothetical protein LOZ59_005633 [Ophidiomyces ophidiicola]|nr:hypothetical protein LOZ59_005633 [Ophidiomyces ophidiicola]KAI2404147.1 hypothetical protein LOY90_004590 [Ophidiomyces ophidiicola]
MAGAATTQHVPAWKKLGFKLKYAKEETEERANADIHTNGALRNGEVSEYRVKKRKATPEQKEETTTKKQKRERKKSQENPKLSDEKSAEEIQLTSSDKKPASKRSPKKTVSFAEGTKEKDPTPAPETVPVPEQPSLTAEQRKAEKRRKREQRHLSRPPGQSLPPATPASSDQLLDYLSTYYKSRSNWRFQKNRETAILKHSLSVDRLPSSYNRCLSAYLSGLQSTAARGRVTQAAKEAIEADEKDTNGQSIEYKQALSSFKEQLPGWSTAVSGDDVGPPNSSLDDSSQTKRFEKRRRAELVYFAVSGNIAKDVEPVSSNQLAGKRKRKTRTVVVEDDTSSSSESDSDSDASDSDGLRSARLKAAKGTAKSKLTSETSGSSSSESDSDSDSASASGSDSDSESSSDFSDSSSTASDSSSDSG